MSLKNILENNNYDLYCKSINIDGLVYPGIKGSTRVSVNPASNPDPLINGLIIPAGSGELSMPITTSPIDIGSASPYIYDPQNLFTFSNTTITIKPGRYFFSFLVNIISYDPMAVQAEGKIIQFLRSNESIFMAPPVAACSMYNGYPLTSPLTAYNWCISASSCFFVEEETEFALKFEFNNTTDVTIALTSGFSIIALD